MTTSSSVLITLLVLFIVTVSARRVPCQVSFVSYKSAPLEAKWIENVNTWQDDVCGHTPDSDIHHWLGAVADYHKNFSMKVVETLTPDIPSGTFQDALSVYTHQHSCTDSSGKIEVRYIHTPIEPTASIVRDPRKCWEQMTEKYTQSKAYLVPMSGSGRTLLNGGHTTSRAFLFDAGATVTITRHDKNYTDIRVNKNNWSGTNWIYEWYKSFGIVFDEVHAWEPLEGDRGVASGTGLRKGGKKPASLRRGKRVSKMKERDMKGKSRDQFAVEHRVLSETDSANVSANIDESFYPEGVLHFYNVGVTDIRESQNNPLYLISQLCKPEDFVVFKLDIDSKFEINLVHQLLRSSDMLNLVDEFYYEHHVKNDVMRMHGLGKGTNRKYTLAAWYEMATSARRKGFRMHFWP